MGNAIPLTCLVFVGLALVLTLVLRRTWIWHLPETMRTEKAKKLTRAHQLLNELSTAEGHARVHIALDLYDVSRKIRWKEGKICAREVLCKYYTNAVVIELHYHGRRVDRFKNHFATTNDQTTVQVLPVGY